MGKTSYDFNTSDPGGSKESDPPPPYAYYNPTFSTSDPDRQTANDAEDNRITIEMEQPISEMAKFNEIPHTRGDNLKFAILIAFPVVFFIVGIVVTGTA